MDPSVSFKVLALGFTLLLIPSWEWLSKTSDVVLEPYLDEVFHVGQAQVYCAGDFTNWDPKITTPPGLYLLSYLVFRITGRCDIYVLRALNCSLALFIAQVSFSILARLYGLLKQKSTAEITAPSDRRKTALFTNAVHTALNICLFPPLFFFFGLYYTDVPSTFFVLLSYFFALRTQQERGKFMKFPSVVNTVVLGVAALFFRQTNIFWVAVFPAGLAVVQALKKSARPPPEDAKEDTVSDVLRNSLMYMSVYDKPVRYASVEDYFKMVISLAVAALRNPVTVIYSVAPYAVLIFLFGAFVAWNGGVVLGDKSNHIATLHTPQMLYIWPYILFFSFPILLPSILSTLLSLLPTSLVPAPLSAFVKPGQKQLLPRLWVLAAWTLVASASVYFNTIIHPFTLADNRHYVFYVFRILRLHPAIKYAAVPVYVLGAWACLQALGSGSRLAVAERIKAVPAEVEEEKTDAGKNEEKEGKKEEKLELPEGVKSEDLVEEGCQASFVLVWLATTTLNLITAPLVEPRYFIVPWIMWRLHFPINSAGKDVVLGPAVKKEHDNQKEDVKEQGEVHNQALWVETAWFLVVNAVTGYIFLHWGFTWAQEPGRVQRFMW
ncbi:Dol-P-Glc:Glc(2)Man(9)GlcNAc(2)-PP-Dol alpha-1 [Lasiodiplodia hormozganensis]|uniref:Dol-P-Glc:Glc(2)Man(9)GlcNAc(2)-PP-Dol alpha-1,2-glucosyltransferase n=1 Tax=Lasiodiplodia hormozganensis TaxID=869390 RepID=A0AA39YLC5_9PEZI|nr:Dol-P-Glc:Glc(2)Man(9)GlcNAc(2)-PP-Dol alpha-1 [Lasiodiplodia hormozganensis]